VKRDYLFLFLLLLFVTACGQKGARRTDLPPVISLPVEYAVATQVLASSAINQTFPLPPLPVKRYIKPDSTALLITPSSQLIPKVVPLKESPKIQTPGQYQWMVPQVIKANFSKLNAQLPEWVEMRDPLMKAEDPHSFSFFTRAQGMPHDDISTVVFDHLGNMWIGTYGAGIIRFDGQYFRNYTTEHGLTDNFILSLCFDSKGRLLIGTRMQGLLVYDGNSFFSLNTDNGLPVNRIESIFEDSRNNIWVGTFNGGVFKWKDDSITFYNNNNGLNGSTIYAITEDQEGNIWFGTRGWGITRFDGESFMNFSTHHGLHDDYIVAMTNDEMGNIWIGSDQNGLARFDGKAFYCYDTSMGFPADEITRLYIDPQNILWIGTKKAGLIKKENDVFTLFRDSEGLTHNFITEIVQDRSGKIWIGTYGGGIGTFFGDIFRHYSEKEGIPQAYVRCMFDDSKGNLWFGTNNKGAFIFRNNHVLHFNTDNGLADNRVRTFYEDSRGRLWIGYLAGLSIYEGGLFQSFTPNDFMADISVTGFLEQKNGTFWIGTLGDGLLRIEKNEVTQFASSEDLQIDHVRKILEDAHGDIWIATRDGGILKYDGEYFFKYSRKEGLPINQVMDMALAPDGTLWVASDGAGLFMFNKGHFIQFTNKHGLGNNYVYSVVFDKKGELWVGTRFGISSFMDRTLTFDLIANSCLLSKAYQAGIFFKNYSRNDGFIGFGVNARAMHLDRQGDIWIGANDIITRFRPDDISKDTLIPRLHFTGIGLFNEIIQWPGVNLLKDSVLVLRNGVMVEGFKYSEISSWDGVPMGLELKHKNNYLLLAFSGVSSGMASNILYQYQLINHDNNWSPLSIRNEAHYGNLSPGIYHFKVRAMNSYGIFSGEEKFTFRILAPWWRSTWAIIAYSFIVIAIFYLIRNYRIRQRAITEKRKQDELLLQQQVEIARKSAEFKQNFLANISHEIRTPLTGILGMADLLRKTPMSPTQEDYLNTLVHSGQNLKETINMVLDYSKLEAGKFRLCEEVFSMPRLFDEGQRLFFSVCRKDITFQKLLDPDLPEFVISDYNRVFQIINNLISNAVKFTQQGKINLSGYLDHQQQIAADEFMIRIEVSDTGSGIAETEKEGIFKPFFQAEQAYDRSYDGTGLGLAICKELSKILGGQIGFTSTKNAGSTFWFTFKARLGESPVKQDEVKMVENAIAEKSLNILLVEDKLVNQKVIRLMLEALGHRVSIASNGEKALSVYPTGVFDLILMDVQMPVMDGIMATQQLKFLHDNLPPIVGLSANAFEGDREKYMRLGMDEYLTKPVNEKDFKDLISKLNLQSFA
jgi:signal transduction histidine kinase/ligand-binding sensor domain-containing protein/CheY-like chemotaxis protein